jgi:hypothetical protein
MNGKFSRKNIEQKELNRFQNIHKKSNTHINIIKHQLSVFNKSKIDIPIIYKFNNTVSTKLNVDISRENNYDKIPKIQFKEIPIPYYSETDNFDLNTINSNINPNISSKVRMDIFASDIINDADINSLKKKRVHKIIHVYQQKYQFDTFPTGFGDFIRGCFFIIQFCDKFNFQYEIIINHPISKYFKYFSLYNINYNINYNYNYNIEMFTENNFNKSLYDEQNYIIDYTLNKQIFDKFINYLLKLLVINNCVFSYNILFPYDNITIEQCDKICSLFEPSSEINDQISQILTDLKLIKKDYFVLHIRSGDSYLVNKNEQFDSLYFQIIKDEIFKFILKNTNTNILLIADNNIIKVLLNNIFPNIKFLIHDITHIGEGVQLEEDKVKNTMLDFFLMSNSSFIFSLTSYPHGTGFSYWCAKMYNIPYESKFINVL